MVVTQLLLLLLLRYHPESLVTVDTILSHLLNDIWDLLRAVNGFWDHGRLGLFGVVSSSSRFDLLLLLNLLRINGWLNCVTSCLSDWFLLTRCLDGTAYDDILVSLRGLSYFRLLCLICKLHVLFLSIHPNRAELESLYLSLRSLYKDFTIIEIRCKIQFYLLTLR